MTSSETSTAEASMAFFVPDIEGGGIRIQGVEVDGHDRALVTMQTSDTSSAHGLAASVFSIEQAEMAARAFATMARQLRGDL